MNICFLSYDIGGYENRIHSINNKSDKYQYYFITDDRTKTSKDWNVIYVDNPYPDDPFELCYDIRFNPFKYIPDADIIIRIDGSMRINICPQLDKLIQDFIDGDYDLALTVHPTRDNLYDEYVAWCTYRNYPVEQANKILSFLSSYEGYDVKQHKGLYQYNFMIQKKNSANLRLNEMTLAYLHYLAQDKKQIERIDQTIGSFVLNKYFNKLNVMFLGQDICDDKLFTWYKHNSIIKLHSPYNSDEGYLFNKKEKILKY